MRSFKRKLARMLNNCKFSRLVNSIALSLFEVEKLLGIR